MSDSILNSTKKILGISEDYTAFDHDVLTHINSVFSTLSQLGIGPENGFMIDDSSAVWQDFFIDNQLNAIRTYVYLRVRLLFDPPMTSYLLTALREQILELEWRLNAYREMRDHPYIPEELDIAVNAADFSAGDAPVGEVLTSQGSGNAEWDPITRVLVLDSGEEVPTGTLPGTVILRRS